MNSIDDSYDLLIFLKSQNLIDKNLEYWWPNDNAFEIFIGAILTQNTKWENVEKSLVKLRNLGLLSLEEIVDVDVEIFINAIASSGFKNQKSKRIKLICKNILEEFYTFEQFCKSVSRDWLLSQKGIGQETADAILCYACKKDFMVVDKYTQRLLAYFGFEFENYEDIQSWCEYGINENYDKITKEYGYEIPLNKIYARLHGKIVEYMKKHKGEMK